VQPPTTVADRPARLIPRRAGGTTTKLALDTDDESQLEGAPHEMEPSTRKRSRFGGSVDVESGTSEDERGRSRPATTRRRRTGTSGILHYLPDCVLYMGLPFAKAGTAVNRFSLETRTRRNQP
jgi:hypothetical protein